MKQELIKIVLVEPQGSLNLGSVARVCKNFGITDLRLVSPRCNPNDLEANKMALKGRNILKKATKHKSLLEAISDCPRVIATCGRTDHGDIPITPTEDALKWGLSSAGNTPTAIIFGREDRGLTNQELLLANKVLSLQTSDSYRSLNLSHSVAIVLHELLRLNENELNSKVGSENNPALPNQLDNFLNDAKSLLLEIGFLLDHTSEARMNKIRSLLQRAEVRAEEVSLIRGIVRQVRWAIKNKKS
tara:strand:- start:17190 stop:17924 length:735 start_codon:yes stop_codon:yes gene_type:complete